MCKPICLIFLLSLGLFFFCWFVLSNFDMIVLVYVIIFYFVILLSLRSLFISNERREGVGSGREGRSGGTGRSRWGKL